MHKNRKNWGVRNNLYLNKGVVGTDVEPILDNNSPPLVLDDLSEPDVDVEMQDSPPQEALQESSGEDFVLKKFLNYYNLGKDWNDDEIIIPRFLKKFTVVLTEQEQGQGDGLLTEDVNDNVIIQENKVHQPVLESGFPWFNNRVRNTLQKDNVDTKIDKSLMVSQKGTIVEPITISGLKKQNNYTPALPILHGQQKAMQQKSPPIIISEIEGPKVDLEKIDNNEKPLINQEKDVVIDQVTEEKLALKDFLNQVQESNHLKVVVPTLLDIVEGTDKVSKLEEKKDIENKEYVQCNVNFEVEPFHNKQNIKHWGTLELSMNDRIVEKFSSSKEADEYKEFWMLLYNAKSQGFFYKEYYLNWLIIWLSSLDKVKIQTLRFPFVWKKIVDLNDDEVLNIVKPNLECLTQLGDISTIFSLLESLVLAEVFLPTDWLNSYLTFNSQSMEASDNSISSFNALLEKNKKNKKD